jgi:hypothetical protein
VALIAQHLETWLALSAVALLTVFSDKIIGRVRLAVNRADLRTQYFEELAIALSSFVFYADLFHVRHVRNESDFDDVPTIVGEANGAYTTLRTKEYVYRSWVRRYWNKVGLDDFERIMQAVELAYEAMTLFNQEGDELTKTDTLGKRLVGLKAGVDTWLSAPNA